MFVGEIIRLKMFISYQHLRKYANLKKFRTLSNYVIKLF
jgi:hypothetical protein